MTTKSTNRQPSFLLVALVLLISTVAIGRNAFALLSDLNDVESLGDNPIFVLLTIAATISLALITIRWVFHMILLMIPSRAAPSTPVDLSVTAVVPAYNEEKGILRTIESLAGQDYQNLEIIVVDDGSTDNTLKIAREYAKESNVKLSVFTQENGGKSSALNHGFEQATGSLLLTVDADSELAADAVTTLVRWFASPDVDAVAGQVKV
ncbi:glycosyltransferase family 2 protein, partial [Planctomycetes bacterium SV_7m_r]